MACMPGQLMVGFFAYAKSLEINVDKDELEETKGHMAMTRRLCTFYLAMLLCAMISYPPLLVAFAHFIVDLAKASMGLIHFLRRGSPGGRTTCNSSEAMITVFTALTSRTWTAMLNRYHNIKPLSIANAPKYDFTGDLKSIKVASAASTPILTLLPISSGFNFASLSSRATHSPI